MTMLNEPQSNIPEYYVGDAVYLNVSVYDNAGSLVNPDRLWMAYQMLENPTITSQFKYDQGGTGDTTGTITNPSVGSFVGRFVLSQPGTYQFTIAALPESTINLDPTKTEKYSEYTIFIKSPGMILS
jgi:hypothetical protein